MKRLHVRDHLRKLGSTTGRLTLTYLMIIMVMSIGFSVVLYKTSSHELGRQIPPDAFFRNQMNNDDATPVVVSQQGAQTTQTNYRSPSIDRFLHKRIDEGRYTLLMHLLIVNGVALVVGAAVSYRLARRTLQPIEAAMEAQVQFVSDASHELRTPLAAIRATNEVALRKPKLSVAEAKNIIAQNTEDVIRLSELSDGLLRLVSQDKQAVTVGAVSLQAVVTEAINQCIPKAQAHEITIDDKIKNVEVLAEQATLQQALVILLDNAIKYSHAGGAVTVTTQQQGKFALLHVRDKGIGIRASDMQHIFRRFYRADTARTTQANRHGYGLGLPIAQSLLAAQHGEILVKSTLGKGSTFTIKLPLT